MQTGDDPQHFETVMMRKESRAKLARSGTVSGHHGVFESNSDVPGRSIAEDDNGIAQLGAKDNDGAARGERRRWRSAGRTTAMAQRSGDVGFGAGAVKTPSYQDIAVGGVVLAREFFDLVEQRNIDLEEPCHVRGDQELSQPLQMCTGFESSGAPSEGGDLGFGPSPQLHRIEARGRFDDSDDEEQEQTRPTPPRRGDRSILSISGVEGHPGGKRRVYNSLRIREGEILRKRVGGLQRNVRQGPPRRRGGKGRELRGRCQEGTSGRKRPTSVRKQPQPGALEAKGPKGPINIDATYFFEWKDGVRTKRQFFISPSRVVEIGDWEASYNQRSLDHVHTQLIIDAMMMAFLQAEKTYELTTLKLAPLGLEKPKSGVRADRLKPEGWKDELAGQYYYYAVSGQHNAAAAKALLGTDVALRHNFERWPAHMAYFSDEEFKGYFLASSEDNKKDLKAPPRQLKLSMKDIQWLWKEKGFPKAVMGNPSGKQAQVQKWHELSRGSWVWNFSRNGRRGDFWHKGAKWITKKRKVKDVRPGVSHSENVKLGRKEVAVEAPQKKGKKEKEPGDWFVQVTEPDPHCWKSMEALTNNEKCQLLKKLLNCEVVWVQTGSASLAKQGKLGVQEAVHLLKCDRILVRLWNYYQFVYENQVDTDWTRGYPFLKNREAILVEFEKQGMDAALWDGSRKLVGDASLFKDCPPYMGCENDKTIEAAEKLARNKKLSTDWKNKVLSVLTGSRAKNMEVALVEGVVHVLWKDSGDVTSIAPFGVDPLEAQMRVTELEKAVGTTKCHIRRDNDAEYMRRKKHMLALLDNYHDASRKNAKNFLDRLECLYFVKSEQALTLDTYGALISTEDEAETGVVFDTATPEEDSDSEDIDIDYHPAPVFHAPGSSSTGPSTSQATQASPVLTVTPGETPSKLAARLAPRPTAPPPLRPESSVPLHHPSRKDDTVHFEGLDHTRSSEAGWGHDMIWHPGTIQQAIQKGEWIMALINDQGLWEPYPRQFKAEYLELARISDKQWLDLSDEFYDLDTSPSNGRVDWKVRPATGPQCRLGGVRGGGGGGASGGGNAGGGGVGGGGAGVGSIGGGAEGTPPGTAEGTTASDGVSPHHEATSREGGGGDGGENVAGQPTARSRKGPNVIRTSAGEQYPYDINWVSGRIQPGIVGGRPCFPFKVDGTWVPFSAPMKRTWRNITLAFVYDKVSRLNDGATTQEKGRYALEIWRFLEAQSEFRLNDFLYDTFNCRQLWVIVDNQVTGSMACQESDARKDARWGWMLSAIPFPYGHVRMRCVMRWEMSGARIT
ncbi:hypothetical protein CBR_g19390 [Chara braunii]|uniref:Uncharacterized protein n=1 Tax=Chara braunii TaxID=69332 RepID=A0A388KXU8_CHABU|nr:hypothetical protein CBR_g19390 [Chara braunii]|eukprot:GBG74877.1 hypothetical protein CBR_g19390 [Chara braunii]